MSGSIVTPWLDIPVSDPEFLVATWVDGYVNEDWKTALRAYVRVYPDDFDRFPPQFEQDENGWGWHLVNNRGSGKLALHVYHTNGISFCISVHKKAN
jgi:hypothetical protein